METSDSEGEPKSDVQVLSTNAEHESNPENQADATSETKDASGASCAPSDAEKSSEVPEKQPAAEPEAVASGGAELQQGESSAAVKQDGEHGVKSEINPDENQADEQQDGTEVLNVVQALPSQTDAENLLEIPAIAAREPESELGCEQRSESERISSIPAADAEERQFRNEPNIAAIAQESAENQICREELLVDSTALPIDTRSETKDASFAPSDAGKSSEEPEKKPAAEPESVASGGAELQQGDSSTPVQQEGEREESLDAEKSETDPNPIQDNPSLRAQRDDAEVLNVVQALPSQTDAENVPEISIISTHDLERELSCEQRSESEGISSILTADANERQIVNEPNIPAISQESAENQVCKEELVVDSTVLPTDMSLETKDASGASFPPSDAEKSSEGPEKQPAAEAESFAPGGAELQQVESSAEVQQECERKKSSDAENSETNPDANKENPTSGEQQGVAEDLNVVASQTEAENVLEIPAIAAHEPESGSSCEQRSESETLSGMSSAEAVERQNVNEPNIRAAEEGSQAAGDSERRAELDISKIHIDGLLSTVRDGESEKVLLTLPEAPVALGRQQEFPEARDGQQEAAGTHRDSLDPRGEFIVPDQAPSAPATDASVAAAVAERAAQYASELALSIADIDGLLNSGIKQAARPASPLALPIDANQATPLEPAVAADAAEEERQRRRENRAIDREFLDNHIGKAGCKKEKVKLSLRPELATAEPQIPEAAAEQNEAAGGADAGHRDAGVASGFFENLLSTNQGQSQSVHLDLSEKIKKRLADREAGIPVEEEGPCSEEEGAAALPLDTVPPSKESEERRMQRENREEIHRLLNRMLEDEPRNRELVLLDVLEDIDEASVAPVAAGGELDEAAGYARPAVAEPSLPLPPDEYDFSDTLFHFDIDEPSPNEDWDYPVPQEMAASAQAPVKSKPKKRKKRKNKAEAEKDEEKEENAEAVQFSDVVADGPPPAEVLEETKEIKSKFKAALALALHRIRPGATVDLSSVDVSVKMIKLEDGDSVQGSAGNETVPVEEAKPDTEQPQTEKEEEEQAKPEESEQNAAASEECARQDVVLETAQSQALETKAEGEPEPKDDPKKAKKASEKKTPRTSGEPKDSPSQGGKKGKKKGRKEDVPQPPKSGKPIKEPKTPEKKQTSKPPDQAPVESKETVKEEAKSNVETKAPEKEADEPLQQEDGTEGQWEEQNWYSTRKARREEAALKKKQESEEAQATASRPPDRRAAPRAEPNAKGEQKTSKSPEKEPAVQRRECGKGAIKKEPRPAAKPKEKRRDGSSRRWERERQPPEETRRWPISDDANRAPRAPLISTNRWDATIPSLESVCPVLKPAEVPKEPVPPPQTRPEQAERQPTLLLETAPVVFVAEQQLVEAQSRETSLHVARTQQKPLLPPQTRPEQAKRTEQRQPTLDLETAPVVFVAEQQVAMSQSRETSVHVARTQQELLLLPLTRPEHAERTGQRQPMLPPETAPVVFVAEQQVAEAQSRGTSLHVARTQQELLLLPLTRPEQAERTEERRQTLVLETAPVVFVAEQQVAASQSRETSLHVAQTQQAPLLMPQTRPAQAERTERTPTPETAPVVVVKKQQEAETQRFETRQTQQEPQTRPKHAERTEPRQLTTIPETVVLEEEQQVAEAESRETRSHDAPTQQEPVYEQQSGAAAAAQAADDFRANLDLSRYLYNFEAIEEHLGRGYAGPLGNPTDISDNSSGSVWLEYVEEVNRYVVAQFYSDPPEATTENAESSAEEGPKADNRTAEEAGACRQPPAEETAVEPPVVREPNRQVVQVEAQAWRQAAPVQIQARQPAPRFHAEAWPQLPPVQILQRPSGQNPLVLASRPIPSFGATDYRPPHPNQQILVRPQAPSSWFRPAPATAVIPFVRAQTYTQLPPFQVLVQPQVHSVVPILQTQHVPTRVFFNQNTQHPAASHQGNIMDSGSQGQFRQEQRQSRYDRQQPASRVRSHSWAPVPGQRQNMHDGQTVESATVSASEQNRQHPTRPEAETARQPAQSRRREQGRARALERQSVAEGEQAAALATRDRSPDASRQSVSEISQPYGDRIMAMLNVMMAGQNEIRATTDELRNRFEEMQATADERQRRTDGRLDLLQRRAESRFNSLQRVTDGHFEKLQKMTVELEKQQKKTDGRLDEMQKKAEERDARAEEQQQKAEEWRRRAEEHQKRAEEHQKKTEEWQKKSDCRYDQLQRKVDEQQKKAEEHQRKAAEWQSTTDNRLFHMQKQTCDMEARVGSLQRTTEGRLDKLENSITELREVLVTKLEEQLASAQARRPTYLPAPTEAALRRLESQVGEGDCEMVQEMVLHLSNAMRATSSWEKAVNVLLEKVFSPQLRRLLAWKAGKDNCLPAISSCILDMLFEILKGHPKGDEMNRNAFDKQVKTWFDKV